MASQNADIVIAIMGVTGVGKSTFIASVTGRKDVQVGHDLYSGKFFHEYVNARS
jgi:putative ribosome biogenesis GTPase RsgA